MSFDIALVISRAVSLAIVSEISPHIALVTVIATPIPMTPAIAFVISLAIGPTLAFAIALTITLAITLASATNGPSRRRQSSKASNAPGGILGLKGLDTVILGLRRCRKRRVVLGPAAGGQQDHYLDPGGCAKRTVLISHG